MIRALIVDDEPLALRGLRIRLAEYPDIQIIAEAKDGSSACQAICEHQPNAVFLDVNMPGLKGTEVARTLDRCGQPQVIFVSAYPEYAIDAFEVRALDYLLKPVSCQRLHEAIERLRQRIKRVQKPNPEQFLTIKDSGTIDRVHFNSIDYINAAGDYMVIHAGDNTHVYRSTMTRLLNILGDAQFVRIHRSTVIASNRLKRYEAGKHGDGHVHLSTGQRLRCSRSYRHLIEQLLS